VVVVVGGCVVVVVVAGEVVVGAVVVVVVAAVVVVDTLVVDDEDTAMDSVVASPLDSGDPLHPERTTRATNTSQSTQRIRHLPMLIFPTVIVCPASGEVNATPPVPAHNGTYVRSLSSGLAAHIAGYACLSRVRTHANVIHIGAAHRI
jgi:hypothetical protein